MLGVEIARCVRSVSYRTTASVASSVPVQTDHLALICEPDVPRLDVRLTSARLGHGESARGGGWGPPVVQWVR